MERELRPSGQANYDAQACLTAMANVSKLFKPGIPVGKKKDRHGFAEQRGRYLRELFKLSDELRVLERTMRDHYEHYDERLDRWIMSHPYAKDDDSGSGSPPAGPIVPLRGIQESGLLELLGYNSKVEIASAMEELRQIYATAVEIVPLAKWATGLEQLINAIRSPGFVPLDAPTEYPDQRVTTGVDLPPVDVNRVTDEVPDSQ